jgi:tRNA dimethylallyltransferase
MLVYRGMDVGTAKPLPEERIRFRYAGLDLTGPETDFSTGNYLDAVRTQVSAAPDFGWIVCGGTGLYLSALLRGLDRAPGNPVVRNEAEARLASGGAQALRDWLGAIAPDRLRTLADPANPRRLIRAIEQAFAGATQKAAPRPAPIPAVGLLVPPEQLARRIRNRIDRMLREGFLEEVRDLRNRQPLSRTAAMAIGYRELGCVLDGEIPLARAVELIQIRTRQYTKRQMTWFRHQVAVTWIDASDERTPEQIAEQIERLAADRESLPLAGLTADGGVP